MALEVARRYPNISPRSYEHPADRAATSALHSIPLLDRLVKRFAGMGIERRVHQILLGDAVRLGPDQISDVWSAHVRMGSVLDVTPPPLYVTQQPMVNAFTFGTHRPVVVVFSSLVQDHEPGEIDAVLAHELGHVLSDHLTYETMLYLLGLLASGTMSELPLAGLPFRGLYLALLEWHRATELTCDRAAAVAVGDPMVVCRMLMRIAGGALPGMDVNAFIRQATEYTEEEDLFARGSRFGAELTRTHPFAVRRVRELVTWVQSGDFERIRDGEYVRRGEEPPPSEEFDDAVRHYRERFTGMMQRTAGGVAKLSGQIASWLSGSDRDQGSSPPEA